MHYFITGGAGFIGSNLTDRLLALGHEVTVWDNLSTGRRDFLKSAEKSSKFRFIPGDNLDLPGLTKAMAGAEFVFHLAANADVRFGTEHPRKDLEQNTIATFHVLEAMRANGIRQIAFSSTGSIYGEASVIPTPEDHPFPVQTSLYGASKLAGEGLIEAYCEGFGFTGFIFRFVSILGPRYTHGHVFDFCKALLKDPSKLTVLGNGQQRKSYLHVSDCVEAILVCIERSPRSQKSRVHRYNLGTNEYVQVLDSVKVITETLKVSPRIETTGGDRGWIGDNPFIFLDTKKILALGWKPEMSIREGVADTVRYLQSHPEVFERDAQ